MPLLRMLLPVLKKRLVKDMRGFVIDSNQFRNRKSVLFRGLHCRVLMSVPFCVNIINLKIHRTKELLEGSVGVFTVVGRWWSGFVGCYHRL